jgi:hypothetical protein
MGNIDRNGLIFIGDMNGAEGLLRLFFTGRCDTMKKKERGNWMNALV